MRVIVDTSVWSLALRRRKRKVTAKTEALSELIRDGRAVIIGAVRQEILSGIRERKQFDRLSAVLESFPDEILDTNDYVKAAEISNACLTAGYLMGNTDSLICAVAIRRNLEILTTDKDFSHASKVIPITLHQLS
ncbi:MAG: putative nucleic acid-binding protein [Verrucomicrobiales bacterium]|jgi:predicted nucleic acid-binding protein